MPCVVAVNISWNKSKLCRSKGVDGLIWQKSESGALCHFLIPFHNCFFTRRHASIAEPLEILPFPLASVRAFYNTIGARIEHAGWTNCSLLGVENRLPGLLGGPSIESDPLSKYFKRKFQLRGFTMKTQTCELSINIRSSLSIALSRSWTVGP
jgi:hypothetical protein